MQIDGVCDSSFPAQGFSFLSRLFSIFLACTLAILPDRDELNINAMNRLVTRGLAGQRLWSLFSIVVR